MKESLVPNLDCMPLEELIVFRAKHFAGKGFKDLGVSQRTAFWLSEYAKVKVRAIQCRLIGNINMALKHERECSAYYSMLPKCHRW